MGELHYSYYGPGVSVLARRSWLPNESVAHWQSEACLLESNVLITDAAMAVLGRFKDLIPDYEVRLVEDPCGAYLLSWTEPEVKECTGASVTLHVNLL
jgi:hypothetical protein